MSRRPLSTIARSTRRPMRPKPLIATRKAILLPLQCSLRGICHRFGRDSEMFVYVLVRTAGSEAVHADELAFRTDIAVPALLDTGFDGDFYRAGPEDRVTICFGLFLEQRPARHGDYARGDTLRGQQFARLQCEFDFRAGGKKRHVRVLVADKLGSG